MHKRVAARAELWLALSPDDRRSDVLFRNKRVRAAAVAYLAVIGLARMPRALHSRVAFWIRKLRYCTSKARLVEETTFPLVAVTMT
jgi:hypothetical protein